MMFKKLTVFFLIFCLVFNLTQIQSFAATNSKATSPKAKVLIVYDRKTIFGYSTDFVSTTSELLGAFNTKVDTINITDYKSSTLDHYDYVFIISINKGLSNKALLTDLGKYKKKICLIGDGIESFLNSNNQYDLKYLGDKPNCNQVFYSNKRDPILSYDKMDKFYLQNYGIFPTVKITSDAVKVLSYVSDGTNYYPLVVNQGNFWYISVLDDNVILQYIFSDILNDIFQKTKFAPSQTFIRIEDVHPFTDQKKLRAIADYLYSEKIPFIIALIPTYVNPVTNYITTLSDKKDFVQTILYMQKRGGSVILHGYTHQNQKGSTTGEGYEFWDHINNSPLNLDINQYINDRIGKGLSSCVSNGIYPLGFEAPHYAMDSTGYLAIKKYFSTYVGEFQSSDVHFTTSLFSYKLYDTKYFNKFIPENLGYIDPTDKMTVANMQENFRMVSIVRGYSAGMFFHPFLDISYLKTMVTYLKSKNVSFYNLKNEDNWVKYGDIKITSSNGKIQVQSNVKNVDKVVPSSSYISSINTFIIIIVSLFCSIFIIIIIILRKIYKNKYFR